MEYKEVKKSIKARFSNKLPNHFKKAMSKPQKQPYKYGDVHNVKYRSRTIHFNKPYPVPCELTPNSCLKIGDNYILGFRCPEGIDEPFPWMDKKYQVSLNFLKSLSDKSNLVIYTRSDLIACDEYINELQRLNVTVWIIYSNSFEDLLRIEEPGAPSLKRRDDAIKKLCNYGLEANLLKL